MWPVVALALTLIVCFYASLVQLNGVDFWLQVKIGEIIVRENQIPTTLMFPFTEIASNKFNAHEWLASVFFYLLLGVVGEEGLPWFVALLGWVLLYLSAKLAHQRGATGPAAALGLGVLAVLTENYRHVLRPELVSALLLPMFWVQLEKFRRQPVWTHALTSSLIVVVWVNSHGSFVIALVLTSIYAIGEIVNVYFRDGGCLGTDSRQRIMHMSLLVIVHFLVSLLNPFGVNSLLFVIGFGGDPNLRLFIAEWAPTFDSRWIELPGFWIALAVWVGTVFLLLRNWRQLDAVDVLVLIFFSALAARAIRFPVYLGVMSAFLCAPHAGKYLQNLSDEKIIFQRLSVFMLALGIMVFLFGNAQGRKPHYTGVAKLSDRMIKTLENPNHSGNVLTSLELGAELIYRAYPRLRPSIDCRVDSFGFEYLLDQERLLYNDDQLLAFLQRYNVQYMLMDRARLHDAMQSGAWRADRWTVVDVDKSAIFLRRLKPEH
ncbi:MAG: hypothetical protein E6Q78_06440 [Rhodoferax sp.]|nr:MAG: hypothetical protein E6Q78_06440 [Rhodoferax sp.]